MYTLIKTKIAGTRCDKCRRFAGFVFMGKVYHRWQRRCSQCADRMVREGKATYKVEQC